ncbi:hypothetical protein [uncultured Dokdonia sp.]|uniref:hypothetical protein n=1 Tax=uncultured Dokdonia sp. TaxID=575653 RepID=UPI00261B6A5F|nr:hypothetical protein [uncultured Dokdonia sp.]
MDLITNQIKLVEGTYSPINSADVLLSLIADKIKFHSLQILNIQDKSDPRVIHAELRIVELKESRKLVTELIVKAQHEGYDMKIDGTIHIEMIKQPR